MEATGHLTARDRAAKETRVALVRAAMELVLEQGWKRTTTAQIAERAGVAKGTFFVHFPTKESLVVAIVKKQIAATHAARAAAIRAGVRPVERLRVGMMRLGEIAAKNLTLSRAVLVAGIESAEVGSANDAVFLSFHEKMIEDAEEAVRAGEIEGYDAETFAGLLMSAYLGVALHCMTTPRAKPLVELLATMIDATIENARPRNQKRKKS